MPTKCGFFSPRKFSQSQWPAQPPLQLLCVRVLSPCTWVMTLFILHYPLQHLWSRKLRPPTDNSGRIQHAPVWVSVCLQYLLNVLERSECLEESVIFANIPSCNCFSGCLTFAFARLNWAQTKWLFSVSARSLLKGLWIITSICEFTGTERSIEIRSRALTQCLVCLIHWSHTAAICKRDFPQQLPNKLLSTCETPS